MLQSSNLYNEMCILLPALIGFTINDMVLETHPTEKIRKGLPAWPPVTTYKYCNIFPVLNVKSSRQGKIQFAMLQLCCRIPLMSDALRTTSIFFFFFFNSNLLYPIGMAKIVNVQHMMTLHGFCCDVTLH